MRPQKARRIINRAIHQYLYDYHYKPLQRSLPALKSLYVSCLRSELDFRTGYETYGYRDAEFIKNNLNYISDRYQCAFRLKWIIDGIVDKHI